MSAVKMSRPSASVAPASSPQSLPLPPPPLVDGRSLSAAARGEAASRGMPLQTPARCKGAAGMEERWRAGAYWRLAPRRQPPPPPPAAAAAAAAPSGVELPRSRSLHLHFSIQNKFCLFN